MIENQNINISQGSSQSLPSEIKGLNWGAFLLNWIWGIGNNTYLAFLCLAPCVGFVMPFVLLFKGNEWAWKNKSWKSVEDFKRVQKIWAWSGLAVIIFAILAGVAIFFFTMMMMEKSEAYQQSFSLIQNNTRIIQRLDTPIERRGLISGAVRTQNNQGSANLDYTIGGPKGEAKVFVFAEKEIQWELRKARVIFPDGEVIDLLQSEVKNDEP